MNSKIGLKGSKQALSKVGMISSVNVTLFVALLMGCYQSKPMNISESLIDDLSADHLEMHVMAWFLGRSAREWGVIHQTGK
jgi:hypothetical protein